jgi:hypothetical protein
MGIEGFLRPSLMKISNVGERPFYYSINPINTQISTFSYQFFIRHKIIYGAAGSFQLAFLYEYLCLLAAKARWTNTRQMLDNDWTNARQRLDKMLLTRDRANLRRRRRDGVFSQKRCTQRDETYFLCGPCKAPNR